MILCELNSSNWEEVLGSPMEPKQHYLTVIAQKPDCSSFLCLALELPPILVALSTVPPGYDFTYCQEWGLEVNDSKVDRTRLDISTRRWEAIKAHRDTLKALGGCQVAGYWFHSDTDSKAQWEHMHNKVNRLGQSDDVIYTIGGQPVQWKTMSGAFVQLTAGLIRAVVAALELREAAIFTTAEFKRLNPKQPVDGGWPPHYQL